MCVHGVRKVLAGARMYFPVTFRSALCDGGRLSERAELVEDNRKYLC